MWHGRAKTLATVAGFLAVLRVMAIWRKKTPRLAGYQLAIKNPALGGVICFRLLGLSKS
jgi:hypothetical protein